MKIKFLPVAKSELDDAVQFYNIQVGGLLSEFSKQYLI